MPTICSVYRSIWAAATARNYHLTWPIRSVYIMVSLSQKKKRKIRKAVIKANFLRFLLLFYMDGLFKHLCLCQQIFSLQLVLRNCSSSPRTHLCGLLQHNQLNLISALFNTWKEPFTEFFQGTQTEIFQLPQVNMGTSERTRIQTQWFRESGG